MHRTRDAELAHRAPRAAAEVDVRALTAQQLATDTPYNTYIHAGLPPTPIANPGVSSITAAVHPAKTMYLFFISDCTGHNHYSVTEQEHEQQINQYLGKPC